MRINRGGGPSCPPRFGNSSNSCGRPDFGNSPGGEGAATPSGGHPAAEILVVLAGHDGDDAKPYPVRLVMQALERLEKER